MRSGNLAFAMVNGLLLASCIKSAPSPQTQVDDTNGACPITAAAVEQEDHRAFSRISDAVRQDQLALLRAAPGPTMHCPAFEEKARFDWNARTFSPMNAALLGEASFLTYSHATFLGRRANAWAQPAGEVLTTVLSEPTTDAQAYVAWNPKPLANPFLVVIFRGTSTQKDFMIDSQLVKSNASGKIWGAVHKGFQDAYLSLRSQIFETMERAGGLCVSLKSNPHKPIVPACQPTRRLVLAGHSLGGAMATLLAADIATQEIWVNNSNAIRLLSHREQSGDNSLHCESFADPGSAGNAGLIFPRLVSAVYTYGSPRVGDRFFAKCYTAALNPVHFRVNYGRDLVSLGPNFNFLHVGTHFWNYSRGPERTTRLEILPTDTHRQGKYLNLPGEICAATREIFATLSSTLANRSAVLVGDHLSYPAPLRAVVDSTCLSAGP